MLNPIHGVLCLIANQEYRNMDDRLNPFHELYVTESIGTDAFVHLFSDKLINHTSALFKPGNIVLQGLPGTGKSMMLNLLKPSIRIAYKKSNVPFPVPKKFSKFIGAGINLIRSSVSDFGQRAIGDSKTNNELSVYFGDFLNYSVVLDILDSVRTLGGTMGDEIDIDLSPDKLSDFVQKISQDDCWFGYLKDSKDFDDFSKRLRQRITAYRSYLNFNTDEVSLAITSTKTSVGIPISETAKYLREAGIIGEDVNIFIRIDQYEELTWLDKRIPDLGASYQSVIHKLLAMRDANVSYRIGTRPFAWLEEKQTIIGTSAKLEPLRNYISVSIDDVLRRPENKRAYIFPEFAEDIFFKRIRKNYEIPIKYGVDSKIKLIREVFGSGLSSQQKSLKYVSKRREGILELEDSWPDDWKNLLIKLAQINPLSARLGEAWAKQRDKGDIVNSVPDLAELPWEQEEKEYWMKERIDQALIQIASRNRQQLIWEGYDDIINLSGGSILAFLSLCQQIWEIWLRDKRSVNSKADLSLPKIDEAIQTLGVLEASYKWYENISKEPGGKERKSFITIIGSEFYKEFTQDSRMSYPGCTGFSLSVEELENHPGHKFLIEAASYGDLYYRQHTTKSTDKKKRIKFYLNPILSPYFKLPAIHIKEPKYIKSAELDAWLNRSGITLERSNASVEQKKEKRKKAESPANDNQGNLFNS